MFRGLEFVPLMNEKINILYLQMISMLNFYIWIQLVLICCIAAAADARPNDDLMIPVPAFSQGSLLNGRYRILDLIGTGSHGQLFKALDVQFDSFNYFNNGSDILKSSSLPRSRFVAVKLLVNAGRRIDEEFAILRLLQSDALENNVIPLLDSFHCTLRLSGLSGHGELVRQVLIFPYVKYDWDLVTENHLLLAVKSRFRIPLSKLQSFTQDMVRALIHLKRHRIVHFDVKPDNVLYDAQSRTSLLTDFSLSIRQDPVKHLSFWRTRGSMAFCAPEIILVSSQYPLNLTIPYQLDMWSLGATLHHMLTGRLLVDSRYDKMMFNEYFTGVLDKPMNVFLALLTRVPDRQYPFMRFRRYISNYLKISRRMQHLMTDDLFSHYDDSYLNDLFAVEKDYIAGQKRFRGRALFAKLVDFIEKCLQWDPMKRLTVEQALLHPFIIN